MARWKVADSCPPREHLPPPEYANGLYRLDHKNRWIVKEKIPTPLDEYGRVDALELIRSVFSRIDPEYKWPELYNVHHLQFPRRAYHSSEVVGQAAGSIMGEFRESPDRKVKLQIQAHNLIHKLAEEPRVPDIEIMAPHVEEVNRSKVLFKLGRKAIKFNKWGSTATYRLGDKELGAYFYRMSTIYGERYERVLDKTKPSQVDVMPDLERLQIENLHRAIELLGRVAAVNAFDLRREAQLVVTRSGAT